MRLNATHETDSQAQITSSRQEFQKVAKCNIVSVEIPAHTKAWDLVQSYTSVSSNLFYYDIFYLERRHKG